MFDNSAKAWHAINRRHFIGGSDVRIIMGGDEAALLRLWREKNRSLVRSGPLSLAKQTAPFAMPRCRAG